MARTEHPKTIANLLKVGIATVYNIQKRFLDEGFGAALYDKPRSGKPPAIKPEEKARITALACSDAPAGYARWTLRLLADKAVEMNYIDSISHMEVSRILKKLSQTAQTKTMVHRSDNGRISGENGRCAGGLSSAL